ncbi:hypothetical protein LTR37_001678 [Vermiconidia calcicola]|uniref:Uncharacterized protein n=1 Tax=Vermiconidia calcicola TaxID=1690605 RepID=A0ACC3NUE8_9PEZI|nr:hypothetical protein LTR37_001678 [Vermiconidia calcicola]
MPVRRATRASGSEPEPATASSAVRRTARQTTRAPVYAESQAEGGDSSSVPSSSQDGPDDGNKMAYGIQRIKNHLVDAYGTWYLVEWKRSGRRQYTDHWVLEVDLDAPELIAKYHRGEDAVASDSDEDADLPSEPLDAADSRTGNRYRPSFERGYWSLIDDLWPEVRRHKALPHGLDFQTYKTDCLEILASIPSDVLSAVLGAGLERRKDSDPELRGVLADNRRRSASQPCIYMLELADKAGAGPTVDQMRRFIRLARSYATKQDYGDLLWAYDVDSVKSPLDRDEKDAVRDGARHYLPSSTTRDRLELLLSRLEVQLSGFQDPEEVLPFLLRDIGYTDNGIRRIDEQHKKHTSSNKLMNLFEAISIADDDFDGCFEMKADVIFLCFRPSHARLSEIVFSLLANSYVGDGRGFNGKEAGLSNSSSDELSTSDWQKLQHDALNESPLRENYEAEMRRMQHRRQRKLDLETEIATRRRAALQEQLRLERETANLQQQLAESFSQLRAL